MFYIRDLMEHMELLKLINNSFFLCNFYEKTFIIRLNLVK